MSLVFKACLLFNGDISKYSAYNKNVQRRTFVEGIFIKRRKGILKPTTTDFSVKHKRFSLAQHVLETIYYRFGLGYKNMFISIIKDMEKV